jgi:hypothetical protein
LYDKRAVGLFEVPTQVKQIEQIVKKAQLAKME